MKTKINNLEELKWEIARLTELKREQEAYLSNQYSLLKNKVEMPIRVFNTLSSSIPGLGLFKGVIAATSKDKDNVSTNSNWLTNIIRVGLPLVLNKTFLKNSGWLKKSLVMLLSDTAAKQVTPENVSGMISKFADFIRPQVGKKKRHKNDKLREEVLKSNEDDSVDDQILGI